MGKVSAIVVLQQKTDDRNTFCRKFIIEESDRENIRDIIASFLCETRDNPNNYNILTITWLDEIVVVEVSKSKYTFLER